MPGCRYFGTEIGENIQLIEGPTAEEMDPLTFEELEEAINTLRTGDADLHLYAYKQFKYPVPNVLRS
jgi:hypothetical protein